MNPIYRITQKIPDYSMGLRVGRHLVYNGLHSNYRRGKLRDIREFKKYMKILEMNS